MALIGMSIGLSFALALVLGPVLDRWVGVPGIFWITAALALGGILVVAFVVPHPPRARVHREAEAIPAQFGRVLRNPELLRLDIGILILHMVLTASFVVLPLALRDQAGLEAGRHSLVYLPVLVASVLAMVPFIILAERRGHVKRVFTGAIAVLVIAEAGLFLSSLTLWHVVFLLFVFFAAFNLLEAMLPSLISRVAPVDCRGTAMGVYSSAQFLGAFLGGALGGLVQGRFGLQAVFLFTALALLVWLVLALTMQAPRKLASYIHRIGVVGPEDADRLGRELAARAGVEEVAVDPEAGVAYLKVDRQVFDAGSLPGGRS
jgi:predicted MFS family arabinose efflux permease